MQNYRNFLLGSNDKPLEARKIDHEWLIKRNFKVEHVSFYKGMQKNGKCDLHCYYQLYNIQEYIKMIILFEFYVHFMFIFIHKRVNHLHRLSPIILSRQKF